MRLLAVALLVSLALTPSAAAHPRAEGYARGFQSKVLDVRPAVAGVAVTVVDGDDRLRIANDTDRRLVVLGYDGEPYLRIEAGGVYRNERSPATYLNRDRFARVAVPLRADPGARPVWRRVSRQPVWQWHDHRIQWMGSAAPAQVQQAPRETHVIFDWTVPGRLGDRPLEVAGRLDYEPPDEGGSSAVLIALVVITGAAALAGFAFLLVRLRRSEQAAPEAG